MKTLINFVGSYNPQGKSNCKVYDNDVLIDKFPYIIEYSKEEVHKIKLEINVGYLSTIRVNGQKIITDDTGPFYETEIVDFTENKYMKQITIERSESTSVADGRDYNFNYITGDLPKPFSFDSVDEITIPEGEVKEIIINNQVVWAKAPELCKFIWTASGYDNVKPYDKSELHIGDRISFSDSNSKDNYGSYNQHTLYIYKDGQQIDSVGPRGDWEAGYSYGYYYTWTVKEGELEAKFTGATSKSSSASLEIWTTTGHL